MSIIPGFFVYSEVITPEQEQDLIKEIKASEWKNNQKRDKITNKIYYSHKYQNYGPYYDKNLKVFKINPHPNFSRKTLDLIQQRFDFINGIKPTILTNQILKKIKNQTKSKLDIDEFLPKQTWNFNYKYFSKYNQVIIGLNLVNSTVITFKRKNEVIRVPFPRRSMFIMSGPSRYMYMCKIEREHNKRYRISMIYSTLKNKILNRKLETFNYKNNNKSNNNNKTYDKVNQSFNKNENKNWIVKT